MHLPQRSASASTKPLPFQQEGEKPLMSRGGRSGQLQNHINSADASVAANGDDSISPLAEATRMHRLMPLRCGGMQLAH